MNQVGRMNWEEAASRFFLLAPTISLQAAMPIHAVSQILSNSLSLDSYAPAAAVVVSLILLKKWSAGTPLLDRLQLTDQQLQAQGKSSGIQDLHGKTYIVSVSIEH